MVLNLMDKIICVGGNTNYLKTSKEFGFKYGVCLPESVYDRLFFADQNWKKPIRQKYTFGIVRYRPEIATVIDLEKEEQYWEVMSWAEEISPWVERIVIIPKVNGIINRIPRKINGKDIVLGYSVESQYGRTEVPISEFSGWDVHLLGGTPARQLVCCRQMHVVSLDFNMHIKMANFGCQYFSFMPQYYCRNPDWPTIFEIEKKIWDKGNPCQEAFRRSCENLVQFWKYHGF